MYICMYVCVCVCVYVESPSARKKKSFVYARMFTVVAGHLLSLQPRSLRNEDHRHYIILLVHWVPFSIQGNLCFDIEHTFWGYHLFRQTSSFAIHLY